MKNYNNLEKYIPEIATRVEEVSRLRVPLDTLSFEVVCDLQKSDNIGGIYCSSRKKIEIYPTIGPNSQNDLKLRIGHELMHHAQYYIEPFAEMMKKYQLIVTLSNLGFNDSKIVESIIRLREGDATWVQFRLQEYYQKSLFSKIGKEERKE